MTPESARQIGPYLDAINIDLKAFTDKFYKEVCGGRLKPVLETIRLMKALGVWVEVTTLIIPGLNDGDQEMHDIGSFVKSIGPDIPWHVTSVLSHIQNSGQNPHTSGDPPEGPRNRHGRGFAICI